MILKGLKYGALALTGTLVVGGLLFGSDVVSYVSSSCRSVRTAVKDAVPMEFELQRARDLLDQIIPEMQANVRLVAEDEVEIATLKSDIQQADRSLAEEKARLAKFREVLTTDQIRYTLGGADYTREQLRSELARRFDRVKEAEVVLAGKRRLQETREKSLQAAVQMLERARSEKGRLEDQIQALEAQYRLVQAASVGSRVQVDNSKLAQTEKLIRDLRKRLDVAERVLAREAQFVEPIQIDAIDEKDLLAQVDEYLHMVRPTTQPALALK